MSPITTHVLDTARGAPAAGVPIVLEQRASDGGFLRIGHGETDADGRLRTLLASVAHFTAGVYRLTFDVGAYHKRHNVEGFYPEVSVVFEVRDSTQHYHVPLLLSPFGYSTYRGS